MWARQHLFSGRGNEATPVNVFAHNCGTPVCFWQCTPKPPDVNCTWLLVCLLVLQHLNWCGWGEAHIRKFLRRNFGIKHVLKDVRQAVPGFIQPRMFLALFTFPEHVPWCLAFDSQVSCAGGLSMCIQQASPVSLTVPVAKTLAKVTPRFLCWGLATHLQCQQSSTSWHVSSCFSRTCHVRLSKGFCSCSSLVF